MQIDAHDIVPSPIAFVLRAEEGLTGLRARESPMFTRVRAGVYAPRAQWMALTPWGRYLARVHAYALLHPDAIFCLESAAVLLGLPVFGEPRDIHVYQPAAERSQRHGDVCTHTAQEIKSLRAGPIRTTSIEETAVDLIRVLPPAFGLAVGDAALRLLGADVSALRGVAEGQSARRGATRLHWAWDRVDPRSESVGESVSRAVLEWCGFARPELQVTLTAEGARDRLDFFWRSARVGGESDGYGKYTIAGAPLDAVKREKRREDRLRRQLAGFARWDWSDTLRAEPLQRIVRAAGVPQPYRVDTRMLATLAHNPRSR